jgi:uncharacterized membrane protein YkoI
MLNPKWKPMKTSLFLFLVFAGLSLAACNQRLSAQNTPALVKNTLKARFPNATEVEWEKKQDLFEAEFIQDHQQYTVLIDAGGSIGMIKQDIHAVELPAPVAEVLRKEYPDYTLDDAERIEKNGQLYYQVELEKGHRERYLVFGADGRIAPGLDYWD